VVIPKSEIKSRKTVLKLSVLQDNQQLETFETTFIAPEE
jgi:hypothetical protein